MWHDDASFVGGDFGLSFAQYLHMLKTYGGYYSYFFAVKNVSDVVATTETDFDNLPINGFGSSFYQVKKSSSRNAKSRDRVVAGCFFRHQ